MKPLVRLENISASYRDERVLSNVSLTIRKGEHLRIRGGNGSGKTTLLRLIRGEVNQDGGIGPSRVWFLGGEESPSPILAKKHVALVTPHTQDLYKRRGWNITGFECVATGILDTPLLYDELSAADIEITERALRVSGTENLRDKSMLEMSRGETRKIFIARALASRPEILLLDELLHELDPEAREEIVAVAEAAAAQGATIIYTSHREDELLPCTARSVLIENGVLTEDASVSAGSRYSAQPPHRSLITAHAALDAEVLVSMERCDVFIDEYQVLHSIDFSVREGHHTIVAGHNGSGKTTLLRTIYGWISPASNGRITRFGQSGIFPLEKVQEKTGYASAELQILCDPDDTVIDIVLSGYFSSVGFVGETTQEQRVYAQELLVRFGLAVGPDRRFGELSYGQQRKAVLARALVNRPKLVLLDEPMSGLDASSRGALEDVLDEFARQGSTIVMAVHHAEDMPSFTKRIVALERGRVISTGERR